MYDGEGTERGNCRRTVPEYATDRHPDLGTGARAQELCSSWRAGGHICTGEEVAGPDEGRVAAG